MSTVTSPDSLGPHVLALDCLAEADRIGRWMVETLAHRLRRRGFVVAISGRHRQFGLRGARGAGGRRRKGVRPADAGAGVQPGQHRAWPPSRAASRHTPRSLRHRARARGARVLSAARRGDPAGLSRLRPGMAQQDRHRRRHVGRDQLLQAGGRGAGRCRQRSAAAARRSTCRSSPRRTSSSACERRWITSMPTD